MPCFNMIPPQFLIYAYADMIKYCVCLFESYLRRHNYGHIGGLPQMPNANSSANWRSEPGPDEPHAERAYRGTIQLTKALRCC